MHGRARNMQGNGYWSNSMGNRVQASASRMSPEGLMRGNRNYSEYRNNRRYNPGRGGHSKQYQPQMPPQETDIFMEAGRLAAEYLVSKGVLPPNALSGKWQMDGMKNQVGEFQGFRPQFADNSQVLVEGRVSAHSRLGSSVTDVEPVRKRLSNENNSPGSRNSMRERRKAGSFRNNGSELIRDSDKSVPVGEKSMTSPETEADNDPSAGNLGGLSLVKDADGGKQLSSGELTPDCETAAHQESEGLKTVEALKVKEDPANESDDVKKCDTGIESVNEVKNGSALNERPVKNPITAGAGDDTLAGQDIVDLVKHFKFSPVPTRPRSSLTMKGSKVSKPSVNQDANITDKGVSTASVVEVIDIPDEKSGTNSSHQVQESSSLDPLKAPVLDKELEVTDMKRLGHPSSSMSFSDKPACNGEADEGLSDFPCSNSVFIYKGKRAIDNDTDATEDFKRHKEWAPVETEADRCLPLSSSMEVHSTSEGTRTLQTSHAAPSPNSKSLNISLFPENHDQLCEFAEEKPLFSGSFKTCDLNLIGTCDPPENHEAERGYIFPSIIQTGKEFAPIDVALSMNNNSNMPDKNAKVRINNNDIEIIDLENDSAPEDQTFSYPTRRPDSVFTDLDGFPSTVNNDVQDGFGLMFSDLLGNDSPNCSSVPSGLNSLHNAMSLTNPEGILGDEDSIYMPFSELPISLLRNWDQQTQDYGKPF